MSINFFVLFFLQFHWNNPEEKSHYNDSSGILLHLTKNKRTHNSGVLMVGQYNLRLPPGEERVEAVGHCTANMTKWRLTGPVHFTRAVNHMHYLGKCRCFYCRDIFRQGRIVYCTTIIYRNYSYMLHNKRFPHTGILYKINIKR